MSQHDLSIANQGFPAFRSDLNDALQALGSMQSGATAPATMFANMLWYDTANNIIKMRNEDNDAWISLITLDQTNDIVAAVAATLATFVTLSVTGNATLGDSSSDTLTVNAKTTFGSEISAPNTFGFKNRIINGAMVIDQRNAGASVTPVSNQYTIDRWIWGLSQASKLTTQQSTTVPTGFKNSLLVTSSSAYSVLSGDYFILKQPIEGLNVSDLGWGAAGAASVTLSFWVRSSLTGTFGGSLRNSAADRSYPFSYTINSANTWEQKTITVAGDTSGTWLTTNGVGIDLTFSLGVGTTYSGAAGSWAAANYVSATGATSVVGTSGATFYITGVQLEKGSTATSFDYRPYGTELALCKRYFQLGGGLGACYQGGATATFSFQAKLEPQMRAAPSTVTIQNGTTAVVQNGRAYANINSISLVINSTPQSVYMTIVSGDTGMTANYSGEVSGQAIAYSAEL